MINVKEKEFLWAQRYRPNKVEECILPESIKKQFSDFAEKKQIPNFLFGGAAGTGKTTMALALCAEIGADVLFINASLDRNIDTLRNKVAQFASTVSFGDGVKVVIFDEGDALNADSVQPALRGFLEEFSANCRFILTCNSPSRIIAPLHSRFTFVDFKIEKEELPKLQLAFMKRSIEILKTENIQFDKQVLAELIKKHFPDFRRTLNELQRYSSSGKIDEGILVNVSEDNFKKLIVALKEKKFTEMRGWVGKNITGNGQDIIDRLFHTSGEYLVPNSIPQMIVLLAEYNYKAAFVSSHELNITACLTEIMGSCQFK